VASLGWVTPGVATEGVTTHHSIFSWKKRRPFFSHHRLCQFSGVTPVYFLLKNWRPIFAHHCHFLLISLGCHPLKGVTSHLFYLSDLVSPLFIVNLPTNFFPSGCHPLEGVSRGGPPPPLVSPLAPAVFITVRKDTLFLPPSPGRRLYVLSDRLLYGPNSTAENCHVKYFNAASDTDGRGAVHSSTTSRKKH